MLNLFLAVVRRDLMLALRQKSDIIQTLFFFAVVITLVPLRCIPRTRISRRAASLAI